MPDAGRIPGQVAIPGTIEIDLNWLLANGKTVKNVMHGSVAPAFVATAAIAEGIRAGIAGSASWTAFAALLNTATVLQSVSLRDIRTVGNSLVFSTGAALPGTGASGAVAAGVAVVLTERTAFAGRNNRGRIYLPGFDRLAFQANGTLSGPNITVVSNFGALLLAQILAQTITPSIPQPARQAYTGKKGALHAARLASQGNPVTSIICRVGSANSQRRRVQV